MNNFICPVGAFEDAESSVTATSPLVKALMDTYLLSQEDTKQSSPLLKINEIKKSDTLVEDSFVEVAKSPVSVPALPIDEPVKKPVVAEKKKKEGIFRRVCLLVFTDFS